MYRRIVVSREPEHEQSPILFTPDFTGKLVFIFVYLNYDYCVNFDWCRKIPVLPARVHRTRQVFTALLADVIQRYFRPYAALTPVPTAMPP